MSLKDLDPTSLWHQVSDPVSNGVTSAVDGAVGGAGDLVSGVKSVVDDIAKFSDPKANSFIGAADRMAVSAWKATSDEAAALCSAVEGTGMVIGSGFLAGAGTMQDAFEEGVEWVEDGLVALEEYAERHWCNIALGSGLSAAFVALAADGKQQGAAGVVAYCAATANKAALATAAGTLAQIVSPPVHRLPGVARVVSQSELEAVITFLVVKACTQEQKLVVSSAGQYLAGAMIYGITALVCDGTAPDGYSAWRKVQTLLSSPETTLASEITPSADATAAVANAPGYETFLLHTATAISEADAGNFDLLLGDFDGDARGDLICIKKKATGSGMLEVHVLSGASGYQTFSLQTVTPIREAEAANFDFVCGTINGGERPDILCLRKSKTSAGMLEVHVLWAASNYRTFSLQATTPISEADAANFSFMCANFDADAASDLICIKQTATGSGKLEVHVLSGASNYRSFLLQTATPIGEADAANFDFACGRVGREGPDILAVKKNATGSGTLEVHALSATSDYATFALQTGTPIDAADAANFGFAGGNVHPSGRADLVGFKVANTASKMLEVHILAGEAGDRHVTL